MLRCGDAYGALVNRYLIEAGDADLVRKLSIRASTQFFATMPPMQRVYIGDTDRSHSLPRLYLLLLFSPKKHLDDHHRRSDLFCACLFLSRSLLDSFALLLEFVRCTASLQLLILLVAILAQSPISPRHSSRIYRFHLPDYPLISYTLRISSSPPLEHIIDLVLARLRQCQNQLSPCHLVLDRTDLLHLTACLSR